MTRVVAHARQLLDQLRNPRERPHVGAVTVRERTTQQLLLDLGKLLGRDARHSSGAASAFETFASVLTPRVMPTHHALPADAQHAGDLGLALAALEHLCGAQPTLAHSIEVTSLLRHARSIAKTNENVTLLCESL
jgi:hypothetical protein